MPTVLSYFVRATACALAAVCGLAAAADFRDPASTPFMVWPNIPVVRASDLADYEHDRKVFTDLHAAKADPAAVVAALEAIDSLQAHHERRALADLGRSLNMQLIGALDRQARSINTASPKLRFEFAGISPEDLQRPAAADAKSREAWQARAGQIGVVAYITYTRLEGPMVQATATLVKLGSGASQSFTVTAPVTLLGDALSHDIFEYFHGARYPAHRNPLAHAEWLTAAPGHTDQLVSREVAQRYCQSQQAALPSADELEMADATGFYNGGVALRPGSSYHVQSGIYNTSATADSRTRVHANHLAQVPNGYYYCIRSKAPAKATRAARK